MNEETTPKHAKFSASGSSRWLHCAASVELSRRAPPQKESPHALEGVQAHRCFEVFLKNGRAKVEATRAMLLKSNPMEMVNHCRDAAETVWERAPDGAEVHSETRVDLGIDGADIWGTADAIIAEDFGLLQVADLKYGAGVAVDAQDNSQLAFYALGALKKFADMDFSAVRMTIIQPRAEHPSGETVRDWQISVEALRAWEKTFADGVKAAEDPFAEFTPGDHCRWCPGRPICSAVSDQAFKQAEVDFAPQTDVALAPAALPPVPAIKDLGRTLKAIDLIEGWIEAVKAHALHVLETGGEIDGYKLVAKKAQRSWVDPEKARREAVKAFGDDVLTEPELLSPAQLEKKFKAKDWVAARITRESSGVTMVGEADPRPAVNQLERDFVDAEVIEVAVKPLPSALARASTKAASTRKKTSRG